MNSVKVVQRNYIPAQTFLLVEITDWELQKYFPSCISQIFSLNLCTYLLIFCWHWTKFYYLFSNLQHRLSEYQDMQKPLCYRGNQSWCFGFWVLLCRWRVWMLVIMMQKQFIWIVYLNSDIFWWYVRRDGINLQTNFIFCIHFFGFFFRFECANSSTQSSFRCVGSSARQYCWGNYSNTYTWWVV